MSEKNSENIKASPWKSIRTGLLFVLAVVVFAYGFQVTKIDLGELSKETRQASRTRVFRALAHPDILEYEQIETIVNSPIYLPCPESGSVQPPEPDRSSPYVVMVGCAALGETITIEGFNFPPGATGPVGFVPSSDPDYQLSLPKAELSVNPDGYFIVDVKLPPDRASDEVQYIRFTARENVGAPKFSKNAILTWEKIIETIFMAMLATALGVFLSVPMSFFAARNLMKNVKSPLTSIAFSLLGWPIGIVLGYLASDYLGAASSSFSQTANIVTAVLGPIVAWVMARFAMRQAEPGRRGWQARLATQFILLLAALLAVIAFYSLSSVLNLVGKAIQPALGDLSFLGYFLNASGDILATILSVVFALSVGGTLASSLSRLGQQMSEKMTPALLKPINAILAALAIALLFVLGGAAIDWFYQIGSLKYTLWIPAGTGGLLGIGLALLTPAKRPLPIGIVTYYVARFILNTVRSLDPVIMAIVFVIIVGIGPFAGVMALGLHTIVSLAKLYSEQVESILPGPLEAIEATGANRLQTIVYAVIPQIIPPYISYTMYRWDINVRMSTIIGITGGGGIGFLLIQNINLLDYNAASTQMIAIAIVVSIMDYVSSALREKYV